MKLLILIFLTSISLSHANCNTCTAGRRDAGQLELFNMSNDVPFVSLGFAEEFGERVEGVETINILVRVNPWAGDLNVKDLNGTHIHLITDQFKASIDIETCYKAELTIEHAKYSGKYEFKIPFFDYFHIVNDVQAIEVINFVCLQERKNRMDVFIENTKLILEFYKAPFT